jgi:hypothetical protein
MFVNTFTQQTKIKNSKNNKKALKEEEQEQQVADLL